MFPLFRIKCHNKSFMCTMRQILGGMVHSNYQWPVENMLHALKVPTSAVAIVLFPFYVVMVAMNKGLPLQGLLLVESAFTFKTLC